MPSSAPHSTSTEAGASPQLVQSQDLVSSLPAPVLRLLILFAWPISLLRRGLEIFLWKSGKRVESWMVIGAWWCLCLGSKHAFRYLLPPLLFLPLLDLSQLRLRLGKPLAHSGSPMHPSTAETLLVTLSDLYSIHALLPHTLIPTAFSTYLRFRQLGTLRLIRGLMVVWLTWFILGTFIGFHSLLAIAGTVFLLLPSPPLAQIIHLLNQSLIIRRTVALAFLFTFGSPPDHSYPFSVHFSPLGWAKAKWAASRRPSLAFSFRPKGEREVLHGSAIDEDEHSVEKAGNPIYFRFEVHENQRWWMGLDWTSALLPQERPSWCDAHLLPVSPPLTFSLPSAASIILPAPTKLDPRARVKRIASWRWLDDDWVIVRAGGAAPHPPISFASPIEPETEGFALGLQPKRSLSIATANTSPSMANPSALEDGGSVGARTQSIAEQAFTKGLERLKARTSSPVVGQAKPAVATASPSRPGSELKRGRTGSQASEDLQEAERVSTAPVETITAKDDATDADGWVYGDNKWESMGARGGLGKFTRRRRWQRRAVCTENVQRIRSGLDDNPASSIPLKAPPAVAVASETKAQSILEEKAEFLERGGNSVFSDSPVKRDVVLRQRLKTAMGSAGG